MGVWDFVSSATDYLKDCAPDPTSVTRATSKIGTAVGVNCFQKLTGYLTDEETRSNMTELATKVAKGAVTYACLEAVKILPGGLPVHDIIAKSLHHDRKPKENEEMKLLLAKVDKMEKALLAKVDGSEMALQAKVDRLERALQAREEDRVEKDLGGSSSCPEQVQVHNFGGELIKDQYVSCMEQKPEDVIKDFMAKEFMNRYFINDLVVPGTRFRSKSGP